MILSESGATEVDDAVKSGSDAAGDTSVDGCNAGKNNRYWLSFVSGSNDAKNESAQNNICHRLKIDD